MKLYNSLIIKEYLLRTGQNAFCSFLVKETDYLTAPASVKYHSCYEGGLVEHSINVTKHLVQLTQRLNIHWDRPESPYIIGMFHDLCKVGFYTTEKKWTKDENGKWQQVDGYAVDEQQVFGHGDKSCYFLLRHGVVLTDQELYCIKYHMGPYNLTESEQRTFTAACKKCPEILAVCLADQLAGIKEEREEPQDYEILFSH